MRAVLLLLVALLGGCAPEPPPPPPQAAAPLAPLAAWHGSSSSEREPRQLVVRDAAGWLELWLRIGEPPPQDFPPDAVGVAVFLGERPTGGYGVAFTAETDPGGDITVAWREEPPEPEAMVTQALTQPWALALYPAPASGQLWLRHDF